MIPKRPTRVTLHDDDVLFFLHIPKTGGISLMAILDAQFSPLDIFPLHSAPSPDAFAAFSPARLSTYRFVRGHYHFGPYDEGVWKHLARNPIAITMLRDPVARTISMYHHILRSPQNQLHHDLTSRGVSLKEFVCDPRYYRRVVNRQARLVFGAMKGWPTSYDDPDALSEEALLVLVKQRLEQFAFVGLTERFGESADLLTYTFGWKRVTGIPILNAAPDRSIHGISEDIAEAIAERTRLDAELYAHAERLFDSRLEEMRRESGVLA